MFRVVTVVMVALLTFVTVGVTAAPAAAVRAIYWNCASENQHMGHDCATKVSEVIATLNSYNIDEVHIWLNGNQIDTNCAETFWEAEDTSYSAAKLRRFAKALKDAGFSVVFTLTPRVQGKGFLDSLIGPDGPAAIANELGGLPIELDMEGNWKPVTGPQCLDAGTADKQLIDGLRKASPNSSLIVSFAGKFDISHAKIVSEADELSPQLYEAHFGIDAKQTRKILQRVVQAYPGKTLRPAFSVECNAYYTDKKIGCSQEQITAQIAEAIKLIPEHDFGGSVFWAAYEATSCEDDKAQSAVCSTYAATFLSGGE